MDTTITESGTSTEVGQTTKPKWFPDDLWQRHRTFPDPFKLPPMYTGRSRILRYIGWTIFIPPAIIIWAADSGSIDTLLTYAVVIVSFTTGAALYHFHKLREYKAQLATAYNVLDELCGTTPDGERFALTPSGDIELVPEGDIRFRDKPL